MFSKDQMNDISAGLKMVVDTGVPEKQFLTELIVNMFNAQYGKAIDSSLCEIKSIRPNYGSSLGYEVLTKRLDDFLRLRFYTTIETSDHIGTFRLEIDETNLNNRLGDEVYSCVGGLNREWVERRIYRFAWIGEPFDAGLAMHFMSGDLMHFMSGEIMEYVKRA